MRLFTIFFALFCIINIQAQNLSIKMEELSAPEFVEAVEKSANTVIYLSVF